MRYSLVVWICLVLVECRPGVVEYGADTGEAERDSNIVDTPQLMTGLDRAVSGNTGYRAEVTRGAETGKRFIDKPEDDSYAYYMSRLVADLHQVYNSKSQNQHLELVRRDADETGVDGGSVPEEEDAYASYMSRLMADLHRVYNGKTENLHAQFDKRSGEADDNATREQDPYSHFMPKLVEDLHQLFTDDQTANLHAEFKRSDMDREETDRDEDEEAEDVYSQHLPQLMKDLHRVFSGETENGHAEFFNRRSSDTDQGMDRDVLQ